MCVYIYNAVAVVFPSSSFFVDTAEAMPENKAYFNAIKWAATFYVIVFPTQISTSTLTHAVQITPFVLADAKKNNIVSTCLPCRCDGIT